MEAFTKQPSEKFPTSMDFASYLQVGETIATAEAKAYVYGVGTDVTATVIASSVVDGTKVKAVVQGGDDGKVYEILFKATTSAGNIYEQTTMMSVAGR